MVRMLFYDKSKAIQVLPRPNTVWWGQIGGGTDTGKASSGRPDACVNRYDGLTPCVGASEH
eukprot:6682695-Ditylum_brightwellii.AAC.1